LATQSACKHGSVGALQSLALLQQPGTPVEPKTHMLLVHAVACWQLLAGVQLPVVLQQGDAPAAPRPHAPALHVAAWQALPPVGQALHIVPQLAGLVSSLQTPLQSWKPLSQV
jgi:hypothetical protein